jgi:hypothetical protein
LRMLTRLFFSEKLKVIRRANTRLCQFCYAVTHE